MEFLILAIAYLASAIYIIIRLLKLLLKSNKLLVRYAAQVTIVLFLGYLAWELVPFIKNENGKSFTTGWFGLLYFLIVSFTVLTVIICILRIVDKRS